MKKSTLAITTKEKRKIMQGYKTNTTRKIKSVRIKKQVEKRTTGGRRERNGHTGKNLRWKDRKLSCSRKAVKLRSIRNAYIETDI